MNFNREQLLEIVKKNRTEHHGIFLEAQEGYRKEVIEALERNLEDARQGREIRTQLDMVAPMNQTREYDRAVKMLELAVDENIELTEQQFANYVMDEWQWSQHFMAMNAPYSLRALSKVRNMRQAEC